MIYFIVSFLQFASFVLSVKYGGKYVFIHSFHPGGGDFQDGGVLVGNFEMDL